MRGLLDTFRRHFVVLTINMRNEVKSRPYWPGGGPGEEPGRYPAGVPTGPRRGGFRAHWVFRPYTHPLRPLQGLRGPLRWCRTSLSGWVGTRYSPPSTHPYYPPGYTPPVPRTRCTPHREQAVRRPCSSSNSSFGTVAGEPRGSRTQP